MFLRCNFRYQVTEETLAVGGVTKENGKGWEEVELLDEDRDIDPEVWMVFFFLSKYIYGICENRREVPVTPRFYLGLLFFLF